MGQPIENNNIEADIDLQLFQRFQRNDYGVSRLHQIIFIVSMTTGFTMHLTEEKQVVIIAKPKKTQIEEI